MDLPISFTLGGKAVTGIPDSWHPTAAVRRPDCNLRETTYLATSPEGLELRLEHRRYQDFDAEEFIAFLTNRGSADTPIVENIRMVTTFPGTNATLCHGNGDTKKEDGYEWYRSPISDPLTIQPWGDGTSCYGAFPYMRLLFEDHGVNLAFGWSGDWTATFTQTPQGVALSMGQKRCHMVIHPGETIRVPSLVLVRYRGGEDEGRNTWRRWYFAHILPKQNGKPLPPKCCMHYFNAGGKPEFTGATEANQLAAIDAYLANGIRPDVWWVDAGWYPCDFVWQHTGNWRANPQHFPTGLKPLGDKCKASGIEFLLWFEPERIQQGTEFALAHPEWCLRSTLGEADNPNLLVDLSNPACCNYVIDLLDGFIKAWGVDIYRQDFNLRLDRGSPAQCWLEAEADDRIGAIENLHIQGYYRLWDTLLDRNPGLLIDSCASGGRRNDIETMRRSVPLHYTDVGYGNHPIKCKQHRQMFEWIPYFRAHNMNWYDGAGHYDKVSRLPDKYSFYAAMAPSLTDMTAYDATEEAYALARTMQPIWRKAAELMLNTDYYPLTECRKCSDDFYAAQFHDPAREQGVLHLLNGATATESTFTLALKGLNPGLTYRLTASEGEEAFEATGEALLSGLAFTQAPHTGSLWFYERS